MQAFFKQELLAMPRTKDTRPAGRAKGGLARAASLSPSRRSEIARKAALARHGLKATHKGNFREEFGIDVECYVLDDDAKTAVIHQRGMGEALGLGEGGSRLPRFLEGKTIAPYVSAELREKLEKPIVFQATARGQTTPPNTVYGYDVTLLIDICKAIVRAEHEGKLLRSQANIVKHAHVVLNASAKAGIRNLVYALAGFDQTREQIVAAFKLYVREEAREYEKEFPDQLYEEWYRLYDIPRPERNKPWKFMHLTNNQVYFPLAKSSGKVLELTKSQRNTSGERSKRLHQFLSEV